MKKTTLSLFLLICAVFATTAHAQAPDQARNYQINETHTGSITTAHLTPPLRQRWSVNFGFPISYPLIADGRVFVTVKNPPITQGTALFALDATTGAIIWSFNLGGSFFWSGTCYENGRVFALNYSGLLRAFDAATGDVVWSRQLPGQFAFTSAPTVHQGVVYTGGAGIGGTVYAVSVDTGAVLWTSPVVNGDYSSPAVTSDGVYVSYACPNVYKLDPTSGAQVWHYDPGCSGGGGKTPALYDGRLYVRDSTDTVFDSETGSPLFNFNAQNTPAFSGGMGFFLSGSHVLGQSGVLVGRDMITSSVWTFLGDGSLQSGVLVVNNYVYVGSAQGRLYAVDSSTGLSVWETQVGASIPYVDEQNVSQPMTGFAAGEGLLVIPTSTTLVAYEGDSTAPTVTFGDRTPSPNAAGWNNSAVDVPFTSADDFSGVQSSDPASPLHFGSEGANQTQNVTVTDNAGNSATYTSPVVNIDLTTPSTQAVLPGISQNQELFSGPVTVTLNASDNLSGVGTTFYKINGGAAQTYAGTFSITADGVYNLEYWSVDVAGNAESIKTRLVKIDSTTPVVSASANPSTAPKRPQPVIVTISGSVTDAVSGISGASFNVIDEYGVTQPSGAVTVQANGSYSFTLTLPATRNGSDKNGHLYTIVVNASDQAGHSASATTTLTIN